jgi:TrwC relaxase
VAAKSGREARTYADVTLSPAKSVSVLHAALEANGRHDEAQVVWECLNEGAQAAIDYLQREAGYSRAGYQGAKVGDRISGRWVDAMSGRSPCFAITRAVTAIRSFTCT